MKQIKWSVVHDDGYSFAEYPNEGDYDFEEFNQIYEDILPYSVTTMIRSKVTDISRIKKDHEVPDDASLESFVSSLDGSCVYKFSKDGKMYDIALGGNEYWWYETEVSKKCLVYKYEEVAYWKNEHNLSDLIAEIVGKRGKQILNCGYIKLKPSEIRELYTDETFENGFDTRLSSYEDLCYQEWY